MRRQRRSPPQVSVTVGRVYLGEVYVRISTIRPSGQRPFVLIPGMGCRPPTSNGSPLTSASTGRCTRWTCPASAGFHTPARE